jgi:hypothetical protein
MDIEEGKLGLVGQGCWGMAGMEKEMYLMVYLSGEIIKIRDYDLTWSSFSPVMR